MECSTTPLLPVTPRRSSQQPSPHSAAAAMMSSPSSFSFPSLRFSKLSFLALCFFGKACVDIGMFLGSHHSTGPVAPQHVNLHGHISLTKGKKSTSRGRDGNRGGDRQFPANNRTEDGGLRGSTSTTPKAESSSTPKAESSNTPKAESITSKAESSTPKADASTSNGKAESKTQSSLSSPSGVGGGTPDTVGSQQGDGARPFVPFSNNMVIGAAHVKRSDFTALVDIGVPIDPKGEHRDDVTILYTSPESLPDNYTSMPSSGAMTAKKATENCLTLKVVLTENDQEANCIAVMGHPQEAFHVHRFHRLPGFETARKAQASKASTDHPFRQVPRSIETGGTVRVDVEQTGERMFEYLDELVGYLSRLRGTLDALRPIARRAAGDGNTVVAMMVNHGQSDVFMNFVCSSRARGMDLSNVLLFATDEESAKLATALGIHVFEVKDAFGPMPTHAAEFYGDKTFSRMVLAKVYSTHLLVLLGYDVLLQDVDVVWLRNPLEYFKAPELGEFDMIFQDDGSREAKFSPYFANTGFYYVKNNGRTAYFFNHFIRMGDVVKALSCDQTAAAVLINENVSWNGLRVKVLGRDSPEGMLFPGGFHFHRRQDYMRKLLKKEIDPYIFHMSWTYNSTMKQLFLSQMGQWFVDSSCAGRSVGDIRNVSSVCCSADPVVKCHYRDRASRLDCRDAAALTIDGEPFWTDKNPAPVASS